MARPKLTAKRRTLLWISFAFCVCGVVHAQSPEAASQVIQLKIMAGKVLGPMVDDAGVVRISEGQDVDIRWVTDSPLEIHLHGYDIETKLEPGSETGMEFNAYATGRFPITVHGSHDHGEGERTLAYLEVYPE